MSLPASIAFARTELGQLVSFVEDALASVAGKSLLAMIAVPAPEARLERLLGLDAHAVLWDPPEGVKLVGLGHAASISASGPRRFAEVAERASELWPRIERITYPGLTPLAPRLLGGFAFSEGSASQAPWAGFGDARFVLPRWLYGRDDNRAQLCLTVDADALRPRGAIPALITELERIWDVLQAPETGHELGPEIAIHPPPVAIKATSPVDAARWYRQIADIRAAIAGGACEKIVAARCTEVELSGAANVAAVLRALERRHRDCYRFGFRFGEEATFVGATPERLIRRAGMRVSTEALAGSIAAPAVGQAGSEAAKALLSSQKDRSEQLMVVQAIEEVLRPLCSELQVPEEPEIRALRHVLHLRTPIAGELKQPTHLLDLAAALHPTPAVGGLPTAFAMQWITAHENMPRGWYAAPIGWFDASGQGELVVAIRSGILAGTRAYVYVGAGIVGDSDAATELVETQLKERAVLGALGAID